MNELKADVVTGTSSLDGAIRFKIGGSRHICELPSEGRGTRNRSHCLTGAKVKILCIDLTSAGATRVLAEAGLWRRTHDQVVEASVRGDACWEIGYPCTFWMDAVDVIKE